MVKKAAAKKSAKKSGKGLRVNFEGVEVGGGAVRIPEGQYLARPIEAEVKDSESSGEQYIAWKYKVTDGPKKGKTLYDNNSLQEQSLWRLRASLEAMGVEVPDGPLDIDLEAICEDEDIEVCIDVADDTYQGKKRSKIVGVYSKDDYDAESAGGEEEEEEEEQEAPDFDSMDEDELAAFVEEHDLDVKLKGSLKKQRAAVTEAYEASAGEPEEGEEEEEEEGGDKPSADDVGEMSIKELKAVIKEFDLDVDLDDHSTLKKQRAAVAEALEGGEEEEEEEGDKYTADQIEEMGSSELAKLVKKHKLDVELAGNTRKKRKAVLEALEEEGLIESEE